MGESKTKINRKKMKVGEKEKELRKTVTNIKRMATTTNNRKDKQEGEN